MAYAGAHYLQGDPQGVFTHAAQRRVGAEHFLSMMHEPMRAQGRVEVPMQHPMQHPPPHYPIMEDPSQQMWMPYQMPMPMQGMQPVPPPSEPEDDKSRWQIRPGSKALAVLEQVYRLDPFPGMEARRELARQLNVTVRQVQVWFQNKRQRQRKVSRAKGHKSTPGLPETHREVAARQEEQQGEEGASGEERGAMILATFDEGTPVTAGMVIQLVAANKPARAAGFDGARGAGAGSGAPVSGAGPSPSLLATPFGPVPVVPGPVPMIPETVTPLADAHTLGVGERLQRVGSVGSSVSASSSETCSSGGETVRADDVEMSPPRSSVTNSPYASTQWMPPSTTCSPYPGRAPMPFDVTAVAQGVQGITGACGGNATAQLALVQSLKKKMALLTHVTQSVQAEARLLQTLQRGDGVDGAAATPHDSSYMPMQQHGHHPPPPAAAIDLVQALGEQASAALLSEVALDEANKALAAVQELPDLAETPTTSVALGANHLALGGGGRASPEMPACATGAASLLPPTPLHQMMTGGMGVGGEPRSANGPAAAPAPALHDGSVMVVLSREAPHALVWASHAWRQLYLGGEQGGGAGAATSFSIFGQQLLQLLQGPLTAPSTADALADALRSATTTTLPMISYTRAGRPFSQLVRVEPLLDANGAVQCFQLTSSDIHFVAGDVYDKQICRDAAAAAKGTAQQLLLSGGGLLPSEQAIDQMLAWLS